VSGAGEAGNTGVQISLDACWLSAQLRDGNKALVFEEILKLAGGNALGAAVILELGGLLQDDGRERALDLMVMRLAERGAL